MESACTVPADYPPPPIVTLRMLLPSSAYPDSNPPPLVTARLELCQFLQVDPLVLTLPPKLSKEQLSVPSSQVPHGQTSNCGPWGEAAQVAESCVLGPLPPVQQAA